MTSRAATARTTFAIIVLAATAAAADTGKSGVAAAGAPIPTVLKRSLAPLRNAPYAHAPYESGDCSLCHQRADAKDPGKATNTTELCLGCHEEFGEILKRPFAHKAAKERCTNCHNPHNGTKPKLLTDDLAATCLACHKAIGVAAADAKVKHGALTSGDKCVGCHNPHGSSVEHILTMMPFDLCLSCHGRDDLKDPQGKKLANMKKWLDANSNWHGPVGYKDCTACHKPHGSDHFRLLGEDYPAQFYSAYDPKNYALCFECHNQEILSSAETTTLTDFRDGKRNLHFLHVNKSDRGRTCRACHEVHGANQQHIIRDAVPYGQKGWMLKLNYTATASGGSCEKTCHGKKSYTRGPEKKIGKAD